MKSERVKKLADTALKELTEALAAGKSQTLTAYLAALARFHSYSFGNVMLIMMQKPDATQVAGFRTWKKLGRWVRKGEKGIVIIAPMISKSEDDNGEEQTLYRFRAVYVFDISQTEGEDLPEPERIQGEAGQYITSIKTLISERGISLEYADDLGSADGLSEGGKITMKTNLQSAEEFGVLVHELAHEILHQDKATRPESKTVCETEAEAVAFVVSHAIGLDTGTASSDYIQLYNGDQNTLSQSLDRIQKTATEIITALQTDEK